MHWVLRHWRLAVLVIAPLVCLALPLTDLENPRRAWCGFTMLVMAAYWISEAIPLSATALLPVLLLPVTGVLSTAATCSAYMGSANMLFMTGLMVAVAVEHSQLHQRIALRVLLLVGDGLPQLMFGFMATSMFLSMWISNTACTAMMVPIVAQLIEIIMETRSRPNMSEQSQNVEDEVHEESEEIGVSNEQTNEDEDENDNDRTTVTQNEEEGTNCQELISSAFFIGVAFAASCGGIGTITGSNSNLVLMGQIEQMFGANTGFSYTSFMAFAVPVMLTCTLLCWLWLNIMFLGMKRFISSFRRNGEQKRNNRLHNALLERHSALGPMNFHEGAVLTLFIMLVVLWITRDPKLIPGWQSLFTKVTISNASPAVLIVLLMFVLPADPTQLRFQTDYDPLLPWSVVQEKVPWGVLILLGGGFALARGAATSGLSELFGQWMGPVLQLQPWLAVLVISVSTVALTTFCNNSATALMFVPIVGNAATKSDTNPLLFMIPAGICSSFGFLLPVSTPPNAIVHQAGQLRLKSMVIAGLPTIALSLLVINIYLNTLGVAIFDLHSTPTWLNKTFTGS